MGWREQLSRAPSAARGLSALVNKTRRLGDWLGVGVVLGGVQAEVSIHLAAGHSCHGDREPRCPIISRASGAGGLVVLVDVAREWRRERGFVCLCLHENTLHTKEAPSVAKCKSLSG